MRNLHVEYFHLCFSPYLGTHAAFLASNGAVAMRYGQALAIEYLKIQFMNATYQHYDT